MRRTQEISLKQLLFTARGWIIALGMVAVFSMPQLMQSAHAQHGNSHHGMAALAEKALRDKEQNEIAERKTDKTEVAAQITAIRTIDEESSNSQKTHSHHDRD